MSKVLYEKKGKIAYVTLNHPKLNTIDFDMVSELHNIWDDFRDDDNLWVAVLSGAGDIFSAGFDIKELLQYLSEHEYRWRRSSMFGDEGCGPDVHSVWKPIVGAFDGYVNGTGLWLALQCDIRIATKETTFALGEVRLGAVTEFVALMARYMPQAIINELNLLAAPITAERAYNFGLINKIVPREQLMSEATAIANTMCEGGPLAARAMKELIYRGWNLDRESALALSASVCVPLMHGEEIKEGLRSFTEKRKPVWKDK